MALTFDHFISDTLQLVDKTLQTFVEQAFSHLSGYVNALTILLMTVYIVMIGYRILSHQMQLEVMLLTRQVITLLIIVVLATKWPLYQKFIYQVFTNEPQYIMQSLVGQNDVASSLNQIWKQATESAGSLVQLASWNAMQYYVYAGLVLLATFLHCLYALGLFVVAKMTLSILLSLGQLFLLLGLWPATRGLLEGWLKGCLNFALIPLLTTSILSLSNLLVIETLPGLKPDNPELWGLLLYLGLSVVSFFMLKQVMGLAALLSQSVSLDSLQYLMATAKGALNKTQNVGRNMMHAARVSRQALRGNIRSRQAQARRK